MNGETLFDRLTATGLGDTQRALFELLEREGEQNVGDPAGRDPARRSWIPEGDRTCPHAVET